MPSATYEHTSRQMAIASSSVSRATMRWSWTRASKGESCSGIEYLSKVHPRYTESLQGGGEYRSGTRWHRCKVGTWVDFTRHNNKSCASVLFSRVKRSGSRVMTSLIFPPSAQFTKRFQRRRMLPGSTPCRRVLAPYHIPMPHLGGYEKPRSPLKKIGFGPLHDGNGKLILFPTCWTPYHTPHSSPHTSKFLSPAIYWYIRNGHIQSNFLLDYICPFSGYVILKPTQNYSGLVFIFYW